MNIFLCSDANNVLGLAATVRSAVENCSVGVNVHVLHHGIDEQTQRKLRVSWAPAESIAFHPLAFRRVSGFRPTMYLKSRMAYARIYVGEVVRGARAIYLDTDLLVYGDLAELWGADLENRTAGAVLDISVRGPKAQGQAKSLTTRLDLRDGMRYFNSGVMLFDLRRWRILCGQERSEQLGVEMAPVLHSQDQDLLNVVLQNDWAELALKWNRSQYETREKEGIVHLIGKVKPWHADYDYHWKDAFFEVLDRTSYKGFRPRGPGWLAATYRKIPTPAIVASKLRRR